MYLYLMILGMTMLFSFIEFNYKIPRRQKKFIIILWSAFFIFLSTVRTVSAGDYRTYKDVFENMCSADRLGDLLMRRNQFYEFLYSLVMFLCKWVMDAFPFFLFVLATIVTVLQYKVVTYWGDQLARSGNGNSYELTSYFILWTMYFGNIFVIRSTLALLVCLYSVRYIERKAPVRFFVCVIAATFFHYSGIIFLCAYVIYHYRGSVWSKAAILIVGTAFALWFFSRGLLWFDRFMPSVIQKKIAGYYKRGNAAGSPLALSPAVMVLKSAMNIGVVLLLCFYLSSRKFAADSRRSGYINLYIFGAIIYISTLIQSFDFARLAQYYNVFQIPIFLFFFKLHEKSRNKMIYVLVFYAYMCLRFAATFYAGHMNYVPFTTILG